MRINADDIDLERLAHKQIRRSLRYVLSWIRRGDVAYAREWQEFAAGQCTMIRWLLPRARTPASFYRVNRVLKSAERKAALR